jgi:hypothetical protein
MYDVTVDHRATPAQLRARAASYRMEAALEPNGSRARGWRELAREYEDRADRLDEGASRAGASRHG